MTPTANVRSDDQPALRALVLGEAAARETITARLRASGFEVARAATLDEARPGFAVAVIDPALPPGSVAIAERLHGLEPAAPLIVLASFGQVDGAAEAAALGVTHFLAQPVELGELEAATRCALELSRLRADATEAAFVLPAEGVDFEAVERDLVVQALRREGGNRTRAARLLGMNRDQIRYRIDKFGLRGAV